MDWSSHLINVVEHKLASSCMPIGLVLKIVVLPSMGAIHNKRHNIYSSFLNDAPSPQGIKGKIFTKRKNLP